MDNNTENSKDRRQFSKKKKEKKRKKNDRKNKNKKSGKNIKIGVSELKLPITLVRSKNSFDMH